MTLVFAACSQPALPSPTPTPVTQTLKGDLTAPSCYQGYNLVSAAVVVRNEKNELIGSTTANTTVGANRCLSHFEVDVPPTANFYQVSIGSHTGAPFSRADLEANGWTVKLNID